MPLTITRECLEQINVTYFKSIYHNAFENMTIGRVLNGIKSDYFKEQIQNARNCKANGDQQGYDRIKSELHAVTFCGTYAKHRNANECVKYNNLLVIDIDKLEDKDMNFVEQTLMKETCVASYWKSPSGKGFKGLIYLHYDSFFDKENLIVKHKLAFRAFFKYMLENFGIELDKSGSDISRLCFMSWDPYLVTKDVADVFEVTMQDQEILFQKNSLKNHINLNNDNLEWNDIFGRATNYTEHQSYRFKLVYIYNKLKKRNLSITETYEEWVKVAYAIASNLHPEIGRKMFLKLCELDGINNDVRKSEKLIFDAYIYHREKVSFGTIVYLAKQKGIELNS